MSQSCKLQSIGEYEQIQNPYVFLPLCKKHTCKYVVASGLPFQGFKKHTIIIIHWKDYNCEKYLYIAHNHSCKIKVELLRKIETKLTRTVHKSLQYSKRNF